MNLDPVIRIIAKNWPHLKKPTRHKIMMLAVGDMIDKIKDPAQIDELISEFEALRKKRTRAHAKTRAR